MSTEVFNRRSQLGASLLATLERERNAAHQEVDIDFDTIKEQLTGSASRSSDNGGMESVEDFPHRVQQELLRPRRGRPPKQRGGKPFVAGTKDSRRYSFEPLKLSIPQLNKLARVLKSDPEVFTEKQREVLTLRFIQDLRPSDVAERLNVPPYRISDLQRAGLARIGIHARAKDHWRYRTK